MATDVLAPELGLVETNEFYVLYEMMMQALKEDDVKEGVNHSLSILRTYLNSGHIALFKKKENGLYVFRMSDSEMTDMIQPLGCIINKTSGLVENNNQLDLDINVGRFKELMFLHTAQKEGDGECIIAIVNPDSHKQLESRFWERVRDTMSIIIKRAASYERNTKAITTDLLTGLQNRNSYEMTMHSINEDDENLVVGVFDLFSLKYVNDHFTHQQGDAYIKKAAAILDRYWPRQIVTVSSDGTEEQQETGHVVYRYGGDEFVLLTNKEPLALAEIKADLVGKEAAIIDLGIDEDYPLGLNYGLAQHIPGKPIKETFMRADEIMQQQKAQMYKKHNIERRR